jgi:hypothetical protein
MVDTISEEVLHPILQNLVKLPFFRYFKVSPKWDYIFFHGVWLLTAETYGNLCRDILV